MIDLQIYWDNICKIYFLTKHYLLLSEELSEDFDTFLQPVKEHRDAFDHLARAYGYTMLDREIQNIDKYREENMKKAVGHTYRAFFDTADWLSYVCRKKIRELLSQYSKPEISKLYPKYNNVKQLLNDVPKKIAEIREAKDLSDDESLLIEEVDKYVSLLYEILEVYYDVNNIFG